MSDLSLTRMSVLIKESTKIISLCLLQLIKRELGCNLLHPRSGEVMSVEKKTQV